MWTFYTNIEDRNLDVTSYNTLDRIKFPMPPVENKLSVKMK